MRNYTVLLLILVTSFSPSIAQENKIDPIQPLSRYVDKLSSKAVAIESKLSKKSLRVIRKLQKEEDKLYKKLLKIDSLAANNLFSNGTSRYMAFAQTLSQKTEKLSQSRIGNYIPHLDTLKNSLAFLQTISANANGELQNKLKDALGNVNQLEGRFEQTAIIQQFLRERRQYLKEQLTKFSLAKHLKKLNKEVYYYSQMLKEYKEVISDPQKLEAKAITLLTKIPAFRKFMEKNSALASVFGLPGTTSGVQPSFTGVQTRASVQQLIQTTGLASGPNTQQFIQQQMETASNQLEALNAKISFVDLTGNPEPIPDFKPNTQKSKSLFKRLEYGANIQFGKVNRLLPNTGEIAMSLGYKLNDHGVVGIGSSYKLGLGNSGFRNIRFSNQGFGLRSFLDWKLKGQIYLSGGYEKNYLAQLDSRTLPTQVKVWQQSGLLGATKKYDIGKKKKGYVQILFDFLSYKNIPQSQPLLFRTGINF